MLFPQGELEWRSKFANTQIVETMKTMHVKSSSRTANGRGLMLGNKNTKLICSLVSTCRQRKEKHVNLSPILRITKAQDGDSKTTPWVGLWQIDLPHGESRTRNVSVSALPLGGRRKNLPKEFELQSRGHPSLCFKSILPA